MRARRTATVRRRKKTASDSVTHPPREEGDRILLRCFGYLRPYWRLTAGAYLIVLGINAINLIVPQLIRWIVDRGIAANDIGLLRQ